jgi:hypothetical protein
MIIQRRQLLGLDRWHEEKWIEDGDTRTLEEFLDEDVVLARGFEFLLSAASSHMATTFPPRMGGLDTT